jgi:hypothetical protein
MEQPLVDKEYLLEKFPGKGGWTYTVLPEISPGKSAPFGWVKVKGSIDGFAIQRYHLTPMGTGKMFLPVKAEIRKKIRKKEGDYVHVTLYPDNEPLEVPEELLLCLKDEPEALHSFNALKENEKENCIKRVYSAKSEQKKIDRIAEVIKRLTMQKKLGENNTTFFRD